MEPQISSKNSSEDWLDLDLPVPEEPLPPFPNLSLEDVYKLNEQLWADTVYDEAYFARSLASKNPEPFVM